MTISEIIGTVLILVGLLFYLAGVFGLIRFPDVYSRIHAAGKVSVLGIVFFAIGTAVLLPDTALKAAVLAGFMIATQPVASHAIASTAFRNGVPMHDPIRNDLNPDDLKPVPGHVEYGE